jgi:hypothetical protein
MIIIKLPCGYKNETKLNKMKRPCGSDKIKYKCQVVIKQKNTECPCAVIKEKKTKRPCGNKIK